MSLSPHHYKLVCLLSLFYLLLVRPVFPESGTNVAILFDGPSDFNAVIVENYKNEITALTDGEFYVNFPPSMIIEADWSVQGVDNVLNTVLYDPRVDIVITPGVLSSINVVRRKQLSKPVLAPWVIDNELTGAPVSEEGTSGVKNLNYLSSASVIKRDFKAFKDIIRFNKFAFLFMPVFPEAIPEIEDIVLTTALSIDSEIVMIPVSEDIDQVIKSIPADVEAVYITPLFLLDDIKFNKLVNGLIERKLPSFSLMGRIEVEKGLLLGLNPKQDVSRQARRIALNVQSILLGQDAGSISIRFPRQQQLTLNMKTARAIGYSPRWEVLTEADLLYEEKEHKDNFITLAQAVNESLRNNLDLLATERSVSAGAAEVWRAISVLLPQSNIAFTASRIDEDRARASMGNQAEKSTTGSVDVNQILFSESAFSNVSVQRNLQKSREYNRDEVRLDIIAATSIAYLNVLRAKIFEKIRKSNLKLSKSNLQLAKIRRDIGVANPSEVYRWESEIALDRIDLVDTQAERKNAEILLNRLLHRPLNEQFSTIDISLDSPYFKVGDERITKYIDNPRSFEIFKDFMVSEGLSISPAIRDLDSQIKAQNTVLRSSKSAFILPDISVGAEANRLFSEGGAGQRGDIEGLPLVSSQDDTDWTIFLQASFPLFRGGAKIAEYKQAREQLFSLRLQRQSVIERVEQDIRSAMNNTGASFPSIKFSKNAADAAHKNLELVTDSYSRGVVSILDLLDAQDASISADLNSATAVYDFFIDLVNLHRAIGRFDFYLDKQENDIWFNRLEKFYNKSLEGQK